MMDSQPNPIAPKLSHIHEFLPETHIYQTNNPSDTQEQTPKTLAKEYEKYFRAKYALNKEVFDKLNEKYKTEKEFPFPSEVHENEFAVDFIIQELLSVRDSQWGKPVKLDWKAIKYLLEESIRIFESE
jgi:hypothetical protein